MALKTRKPDVTDFMLATISPRPKTGEPDYQITVAATLPEFIAPIQPFVSIESAPEHLDFAFAKLFCASPEILLAAEALLNCHFKRPKFDGMKMSRTSAALAKEFNSEIDRRIEALRAACVKARNGTV